VVAKQQFNVLLPTALVRAVKHRAIDEQLSLSDLVAAVIERFLTEQPGAGREAPGPVPEMKEFPVTTSRNQPELRLQPMVHVADMAAAVEFYERLGGEVVHGSRDGDWVLMTVGGAEVGLLAHPPNPEQGEATVELNFAYTGTLAEFEERLRASGLTIARPTTDEGFGRQLQVSSPEGLLVKINELEPELYT
jgi:catechol 2,3-dioxygenase-like lactoylglutathione lyase family enzyme